MSNYSNKNRNSTMGSFLSEANEFLSEANDGLMGKRPVPSPASIKCLLLKQEQNLPPLHANKSAVFFFDSSGLFSGIEENLQLTLFKIALLVLMVGLIDREEPRLEKLRIILDIIVLTFLFRILFPFFATLKIFCLRF